MTSRIVTDPSTGEHVDKFLEVIFNDLFQWNVKGEIGDAIEMYLDQYTTAIWGDAAVPSKGITRDVDAAKRWAKQFGELRITPVSRSLVKQLRASYEALNVEIKYSAKIGPDRDNQKHVYGRSVHQVALLAGVQVLRETAHMTLNKTVDQQHH